MQFGKIVTISRRTLRQFFLTNQSRYNTLCNTSITAFRFLCKIGDFEIARLVCLQNKVCWHSLERLSFLKFHLEINRWQYVCNNVYSLWIWKPQLMKPIMRINPPLIKMTNGKSDRNEGCLYSKSILILLLLSSFAFSLLLYAAVRPNPIKENV